ncbi:MAG: hypothetical protein AAGC74_07050 [Verrucomicrobiota bacterium]
MSFPPVQKLSPSITSAASAIWALLLTSSPGTAQYFDALSNGMTAVVEINGFPCFESPSLESGTTSLFLGSTLQNGENTITWNTLTSQDSITNELPAWTNLEIFAAPADLQRTYDNLGQRLFSKRINANRNTVLAPVTPGKVRFLKGTLSKDGELSFQKISERSWALGLSLHDPELHFLGLPSKLNYARISDTLAHLKVHFIDSQKNRQLVFGDLKLIRGGGTLILNAEQAIRGRQHYETGTFDQVWLFGTSSEGVKEMNLGLLDIDSYQIKSSGKETFQAEIEHRWSWQDGANMKDLLEDPSQRQILISYLREVHLCLDQEAPDQWPPYFANKLADLVKSMAKPLELLAEEQMTFFQNLHQTDGWGLEPFDEERLLFRPLNEKVLAVSYVDGPGPLRSKPIRKNESTPLERFTIPLFLSNIDGKWTIVR